MNFDVRAVVEACTRASEDDSLGFRRQLVKLATVAIEAYHVDLRRSIRIYYPYDGETIEVPCTRIHSSVARNLDPMQVESAIREVEAGACTYKQFCAQIMAAGCAGYLVSLIGRRVLYFGRSAETYLQLISTY
jgi:uncharacterized protein YbcV (DUF1398 family)